jgi:Spy/CpxP family protein refolding chaperone
MHPHVMAWWAHRRAAESVCHPGGGACHSGKGFHGGCGGSWHHAAANHPPHEGDGGAFGVRRPLRFLTHKLDLDERQSTALARILDELKTERAQAAVDDRRTTSGFAAAFEHEGFDENGAREAAEKRVESAKRLRDAVVKALRDIHALLDPEQRETFAYLIRTGVLSL